MENSNPLVSYTILCYNRKPYLRKAIQTILAQDYEPIEIVVVDNNSSDHTEELFMEEFVGCNIRFKQLNENLGVSGGRNVVMGMAEGEIIVIIDDDAEVIDRNATKSIINKFQDDSTIGALAFKIVDYDSRDIQKNYRLNRNRSLSLNTEFENWGFRGAGHAMRRSIFEQVGPYPDYSPWGHEEFDICLKILDAGYRIIYYPQIEIAHHRTLSGRLNNADLRAVSLENRIKVALRNLPWRYVLTTTIFWSLRILVLQTKFNFFVLIRAYKNLWSKWPEIMKERKVIQMTTLKRAAKLGAPLYF